jgi:uncharacterized protein
LLSDIRDIVSTFRNVSTKSDQAQTVELRSAFRRRVSEGSLNDEALPEILKRLAADREFWALIDVSSRVLVAAETLVAAHPLRTLDAIHVASARIFAARIAHPTLVFVTADVRQMAAAAAAGMTARHIAA